MFTMLLKEVRVIISLLIKRSGPSLVFLIKMNEKEILDCEVTFDLNTCLHFECFYNCTWQIIVV
jgi:hypothetical protein